MAVTASTAANGTTRSSARRPSDVRLRRIRRIGTGGFGFVYLAEPLLHRACCEKEKEEEVQGNTMPKRVVLKVSKSADCDATINDEARVLRRVQETVPEVEGRVPRVLWVGTAEGRAAYAMTLHGPSLATISNDPWQRAAAEEEAGRGDRVAGGSSDPSRRKREAIRALRALGHAAETLGMLHARGWVHRDVKPENVLVSSAEGWKDDGGDSAVLIDFGLARRYCTAEKSGCGGDEDKQKQAKPPLLHRDCRAPRFFSGTTLFAPAASHAFQIPLPEDDIESLVYSALSVVRGKLPWQFVDGSQHGTLRQMKRNFAPRQVCRGELEPLAEVVELARRHREARRKACRSGDPEPELPYAQIAGLFRQCADRFQQQLQQQLHQPSKRPSHQTRMLKTRPGSRAMLA